MEVEEDFGEYIQGFFIMKLNINCSDRYLDLNTLSKEDQGTYVHEFIHFLQEISTTSGLSRIIYEHKILQGCLALGKVGELKEVELNSIEGKEEATEIYNYYDGDSIHKKINPKYITVVEEEYEYLETLSNSISDEAKEVLSDKVIYLKYENYDGVKFMFGRYAIMESMAYLIEANLINITKKEWEYPYNACEIMCQKVYPKLKEHVNIIVAMCELSLMHYNSGVFFYDLLQDMKKNNCVFHSINEFWTYYKPKVGQLCKNYNKEQKELLEVTRELYKKNSSVSVEVNHKIVGLLQGAKKRRNYHRTKCPLFISMIMDDVKLLAKYFRVFKPMILTNDEAIYSITETRADICMYGAYAVRNLYTTSDGKALKCCMYNACKASNNPLLDDSCLTNPLMQAYKEEQLCVVGAFLYMYGKV